MLRISDRWMLSDLTTHRAWCTGGYGHLWVVTWLPERELTYNEAITAVSLAEMLPLDVGERTTPIWTLLQSWADELDIEIAVAVDRLGELRQWEDEVRNSDSSLFIEEVARRLRSVEYVVEKLGEVFPKIQRESYEVQ